MQITFGSGWVGPGLFWMENRKLENHNFFLIFDDFWFPKKKKLDRGGSLW